MFVSKALMPDDLKFDGRKEGQPTFYSKEEVCSFISSQLDHVIDSIGITVNRMFVSK
jgi:hypothetical protein